MKSEVNFGLVVWLELQQDGDVERRRRSGVGSGVGGSRTLAWVQQVTMVEIRRGRARPRAMVMSTVRERDEQESMGSEMESSLITRPRMWLLGRWCWLNPLRCWWMRILCILCACTLVIVVGVVVYKNGLSNKRQEIQLKCENRKEVSTLLLSRPGL